MTYLDAKRRRDGTQPPSGRSRFDDLDESRYQPIIRRSLPPSPLVRQLFDDDPLFSGYPRIRKTRPSSFRDLDRVDTLLDRRRRLLREEQEEIEREAAAERRRRRLREEQQEREREAAALPPPRTGDGRVCQAVDVYEIKSRLQAQGQPDRVIKSRCSRASMHARDRFWECFPGGRFVRIDTPGTNLECGLYAIQLSMRSQAAARDQAIAPPTRDDLLAVMETGSLAMRNTAAGMTNVNNFTADQLAAAFSAWGRRRGLRCQLGWIQRDGMPVMMSTPDVDTSERGRDIIRIWVYNDGRSLAGGVGHFEGIRRP